MLVTKIETTEGVTSEEIAFASSVATDPPPISTAVAVALHFPLVASERAFVRLSAHAVIVPVDEGAAIATEPATATPATNAMTAR